MAVRLGKVGVWKPESTWNLDNGAHRDAVAELDELGYGTVWLGNADGGLRTAEAFLAATSRLVLATGIVNVWTHSPAELAAAYQRVNGAYPDRMLVGIGVSHAPLVEPTGQVYTKPYSKLVGFLDGLDAAEPALPAAGRVLGALSPRSLGLARDRAAGAHPYLTTPEHTSWAREILHGEALLAPEQKVVLARDPIAARELARRVVGMYLALPNYTNNLRRFGFTDQDFADGGSDRLIDAVVAWGDVDAVRHRVREHLDAGADHVALQVLTAEDEPPLREWRELAPAIAEA